MDISFIINESGEERENYFNVIRLGGHKSLFQSTSTKHGDFDDGNNEHRIFRLYIGLEDVDYLIEDL